MSIDLPPYYFRVRENGAAVFRVSNDERMRRIDMQQIAVVNVRNGEIKPQGGRRLSVADIAAIRDWMTERQAVLKAREEDDLDRAIDYLNTTAQWLQSKATDEDVDRIADRLLLAMHDLRTVLVRRMAERRSGRDDD